jgi:hypothetical protein
MKIIYLNNKHISLLTEKYSGRVLREMPKYLPLHHFKRGGYQKKLKQDKTLEILEW